MSKLPFKKCTHLSARSIPLIFGYLLIEIFTSTSISREFDIQFETTLCQKHKLFLMGEIYNNSSHQSGDQCRYNFGNECRCFWKVLSILKDVSNQLIIASMECLSNHCLDLINRDHLIRIISVLKNANRTEMINVGRKRINFESYISF